MKITRIDHMHVFVPWQDSYKEPMVSWRAGSRTTPEAEDSYVIVKVHTDEGLVGIGEGVRSVEESERRGQAFLGRNPMEIDIFNLGRPWAHAMVDIVGKALGVPAYRLFGNGKHRDRVPVDFWSPYLPPRETAVHAEEGARRGFVLHKIKARPWDAVEQVEAMTAAGGPEYGIRIDPNQRFDTPMATVRIDDRLGDYPNVECFEDPCDKTRPDWWALLRQKCRAPMALHSSDPKLILEHLRHGGIDIVNVGGTANRAIRAAAVAEAGGCPVWIQMEGHCYDIQAAYCAHLGAAIPNASLPYGMRPFIREAPITREGYGFQVEDSHMPVPEEPGLGITLDDEICERYRIG